MRSSIEDAHSALQRRAADWAAVSTSQQLVGAALAHALVAAGREHVRLALAQAHAALLRALRLLARLALRAAPFLCWV